MWLKCRDSSKTTDKAKPGLATAKDPKHSFACRALIHQRVSQIGNRKTIMRAQERERQAAILSNSRASAAEPAERRMTAARSISRIGPVAKVRHPLMMSGGKARCHVSSDLIFFAGIPTIVLAWNHPAVTVTLDPSYLHEINWPEAKYLYELSIKDPRGVVGSDMGSKTPQMTEPSSEPIPNDVRAAFLEAIRLYDDCRLADPACSVSFRRMAVSLGGVCDLVLSYRNEPLPANVHDELWNLVDNTRVNLKVALAKDPSYATGAQYLLKLIDESPSGRQAAGGRPAPRMPTKGVTCRPP